MRRTLSILVAVVLAIVVVVTVGVAVSGSGKKHLVVVRGAIGSEKQAFFNDPKLHEFIASAGGAGAPEITVTEAVSSPDEF